MAETSKELLDQPSKPSPFEGLLLGCNTPKSQKKKNLPIKNEKGRVLTTEVPKSQEGLLLGCNTPKSQKKKNLPIENEKGRVLTTEVPKSQVLGKVKDFLGVMAKANEKLELGAQGTSRSDFDIEVLNGNEKEYIEMDLLLGVADLQTPEAVAAAEATVGGFQPPAATSSSSCSDAEDESDEDTDSGSDSDDQRLRDDKLGCKPNKRPKIVVLN